jgi:hypothetical protein
MLPIAAANSDKYYTGAFEIFGYFTVEDEIYMLFRNCVQSVEQNRENSLAKTVFGEAKFPKDNITVTRMCNIINTLGYFPVLSWVPGVLNISRGIRNVGPKANFVPETKKAFTRAAVIKGIFQMFCLGIVFLPTDLWITIQRGKNPPDLTQLFNKTKNIKPGEIKNLDILRIMKGWSNEVKQEPVLIVEEL